MIVVRKHVLYKRKESSFIGERLTGHKHKGLVWERTAPSKALDVQGFSDRSNHHIKHASEVNGKLVSAIIGFLKNSKSDAEKIRIMKHLSKVLGIPVKARINGKVVVVNEASQCQN